MKALTLLALASAARAHYTFPSLIANGVTTTAWQYARQWTGYYTNDPVTSVSTLDIRCNVDGSTKTGVSTMSVAAGTTIGFAANQAIFHPGPLQFYMAKVPAGQTAATWDGSGNVWFKIFGQGPIFGASSLTWPSEGETVVTTKLPASLPNGDYLFRVEHTALHSASAAGGAQFYISCAQITVTGGGSGTPGPLVAFPGAYSATDPGLMIDIYYPVPTTYTLPGPAVWTG